MRKITLDIIPFTTTTILRKIVSEDQVKTKNILKINKDDTFLKKIFQMTIWY
jgi:hypothetical protein